MEEDVIFPKNNLSNLTNLLKTMFYYIVLACVSHLYAEIVPRFSFFFFNGFSRYFNAFHTFILSTKKITLLMGQNYISCWERRLAFLYFIILWKKNGSVKHCLRTMDSFTAFFMILAKSPFWWLVVVWVFFFSFLNNYYYAAFPVPVHIYLSEVFSGDGRIYISFDANAHKMSLVADSIRRWIFNLYFQVWRLPQKYIIMESSQT